MAQKIRISKPGYNVLTETDQRNIVFDSDYNHLKTAGSGSFSEALASFGTHTETILHGLGYKPLVLAYWRDTATSQWRITMSNPSGEARYGTSQNVEVTVDSTAVYFNLKNGSGARTLEVMYEFFYEGS